MRRGGALGAGVVLKRSGAEHDSDHEFFHSLFSPAFAALKDGATSGAALKDGATFYTTNALSNPRALVYPV
jgi:hypothetical protein